MDKNTQVFIENHVNDDIHALALQASKFPDVDMEFVLTQIMGKQKMKYKVPTFYHCRDVLYPVKLSLEQSSSEITAKHKLKSCTGNILMDLTGGFGVDTYFFSFKFHRVIYVERQKELCEIAEHNFKVLGRNNIDVVHDIAENRLENITLADWIYLDPARRTKSGQKAVFLRDCEPDITKLQYGLLEKANHIMIKLSPMIDIANVLSELPQAAEIQIVAVENECKEVLVILHRDKQETVTMKTINYTKNEQPEVFDFALEDEQIANPKFTDKLCSYLYEPNAAVMKSGAFKLISNKFGMYKLHKNSHLYTSDKYVADFPGRIFKVEETFDFGKESMKNFHSKIKKANLSTRNFPLSVNELRKKLKLQDGGEDYLFATTLLDNTKTLIRAKKFR